MNVENVCSIICKSKFLLGVEFSLTNLFAVLLWKWNYKRTVYHTVKLRFHADTDAQRQCGLGCGWQCWYRGGVASLGISFAGLPKLEKQKKKEPDASDSFKVLSEDDHRNS